MSDEDWDADVSTEKKSRSSGPREYHSKSYTNSSRRDRDYEKDSFRVYEKDSSRGSRGYEKDSSRSYRSSEQNWRSDERSSRNSSRYSDSMQINRDQVGMIIGRGGSNIKDIQSKFSVNVNVDKNSNESGTNSVSVSGDSQSNVDDAITHIRDQVENAPQRGYDRRRDDRRQNHNSGGYGGYDNDRYSREDKKDRDGDYGGYKKEYNSNSGKYNRDESDTEQEYKPIDWDALNKMAEEERKARWAKCPKMIKNFYEEHPDVAALTPEQVARIREENNNITVERLIFKDNEESLKPIPNPVWKFEQCFEKYPDLMEEIRKQVCQESTVEVT